MSALLLVFMSFVTSSAFADNAEWFSKVPQHLRFGTYLGQRGGIAGRCSLDIFPSDKNGIIVVMKTASLFDLGGNNEEVLGDMHILPSDRLIGSNQYPQGPYESETEIAFGYLDDSGESKSLHIHRVDAKKVVVYIESVKNGALNYEACILKVRNE